MNTGREGLTQREVDDRQRQVENETRQRGADGAGDTRLSTYLSTMRIVVALTPGVLRLQPFLRPQIDISQSKLTFLSSKLTALPVFSAQSIPDNNHPCLLWAV